MKRYCQILAAVALLIGLAAPGYAQVFLNELWTDGSRAEQGLPNQSQWYSSSAATLTTASGTMTGAPGTSSRLWITYFTDGGSAPVQLNVGDMLKASLVFTPNGVVTAPTTARGLRIGLFNFSNAGSARVTADGTFSTGSGAGAPGANVTGYLLNGNFAQTVTTGNPFEIRERTDLANIDLMGAAAVYTTLGSGGGALNDPQFASGTQYTLEFSVTRTAADSVGITTRFFGNNLDVSVTTNDASGTTFAFDTFAMRPANEASTATSFAFSNFKVELIPVPEPSLLALAGIGALSLVFRRRSC